MRHRSPWNADGLFDRQFTPKRNWTGRLLTGQNFDIIRTVSTQLHTTSIHHSSYRSSIYFWVSDSEAFPTVGGTLRTHQFWFVLEFTTRHTACSHCERHHHEPNKWRGRVGVFSSGFRTSQETQKLQKSPEFIWGWVGFRFCRSGVWCHATDWTGFFVRWRASNMPLVMYDCDTLSWWIVELLHSHSWAQWEWLLSQVRHLVVKFGIPVRGLTPYQTPTQPYKVHLSSICALAFGTF